MQHTKVSLRSAPASPGGIVLQLLGLLCLVSLAVVAGVGYLLWQDTDGSPLQLLTAPRSDLSSEQTDPTNSLTAAEFPSQNLLVPEFIVDAALQPDYNDLTQQLLIPLRAYYATKEERLGDIRVQLSEDIDHTTQVAFELIDADEVTVHTFFYDRTGKDKQGPYPTWEPSLLDITN